MFAEDDQSKYSIQTFVAAYTNMEYWGPNKQPNDRANSHSNSHAPSKQDLGLRLNGRNIGTNPRYIANGELKSDIEKSSFPRLRAETDDRQTDVPPTLNSVFPYRLLRAPSTP